MSFHPRCSECQRIHCGKNCGCECHPFFYRELEKKKEEWDKI